MDEHANGTEVPERADPVSVRGQRVYDDAQAKLRVVDIIERTKWAREMDHAATDLMLAAEALIEQARAVGGDAVWVLQALETPHKAWRAAVLGYRNAGGLRTDNGGLVVARGK
jgi:uncharacterized protein YbjQ (UPF0145 family)